jgi:hypothetical protein
VDEFDGEALGPQLGEKGADAGIVTANSPCPAIPPPGEGSRAPRRLGWDPILKTRSAGALERALDGGPRPGGAAGGRHAARVQSGGDLGQRARPGRLQLADQRQHVLRVPFGLERGLFSVRAAVASDLSVKRGEAR